MFILGCICGALAVGIVKLIVYVLLHTGVTAADKFINVSALVSGLVAIPTLTSVVVYFMIGISPPLWVGVVGLVVFMVLAAEFINYAA